MIIRDHDWGCGDLASHECKGRSMINRKSNHRSICTCMSKQKQNLNENIRSRQPRFIQAKKQHHKLCSVAMWIWSNRSHSDSIAWFTCYGIVRWACLGARSRLRWRMKRIRWWVGPRQKNKSLPHRISLTSSWIYILQVQLLHMLYAPISYFLGWEGRCDGSCEQLRVSAWWG